MVALLVPSTSVPYYPFGQPRMPLGLGRMLIGKSKRSAVMFLVALVLGNGLQAASAQECLLAAELHHVSRMAAATGIAVGIQQCAKYLTPEEFRQIQSDFESAGFIVTFRQSQEALKTLRQEKINYIDSLFRPYVAAYAKELSSDRESCRKVANAVEGFAVSPEARERLYQIATTDLALTQCR